MAGGGEHGARTVLAAMAAQAVVAGAAAAAFTVTGSTASLAVGLLAGAATVSPGLLLLGGRRARRAADGHHPFGAGRERYFWAFVASITLFGLAAAGAVVEGLRTIDRPEPLDDPAWAYGTLGAGLVVAGVVLRLTTRRADAVRGRSTWAHFVHHARWPELPVALVEGVGVVIGLVAGLAAVVAAEATDDAAYDGIGAVTVGGLMAVVAVVLLVAMKSLLIGEPATRKDVESIRAAVEVDPAVRALIHMRAQHQGPEELLVAMKVELDHTLTLPEVSEVVNRIERNVRRTVPAARLMFIEPDVDVGRRAAPAIGEHVPAHDVPEEIRAKQKIEDQRGALGIGIPLEADDR